MQFEVIVQKCTGERENIQSESRIVGQTGTIRGAHTIAEEWRRMVKCATEGRFSVTVRPI
jgi:hypothetical protein